MDFSYLIELLSKDAIFQITYFQMISCFCIILFTLIVSKVFRIIIENKIKVFVEKTRTEIDDKLIDGLERPLRWFIIIIGFYCAVLVLDPTNDVFPLRDVIQASVETLIAIFITWAAFVVTDIFTEELILFLDERACKKAEKEGEACQEPIIVQFLPLFKKAFKVALVLIAAITIIQNRGYSVTSLLAGFGITGLAIGFAAKDSIANIFGSVAVMVDNVYKIGDWIQVDKTINGSSVEGIVEDISLRSTKIRAFDRTLLTIPNNEMANAVIKNVSKHDRRRILCYLDIEYNTPPDKVKQAVESCRRIVSDHPDMYPYQEIHFTEFASCSLRIMLYLFTKTTDWHKFMVIRQEVFLSIMEEFKKLGVGFAYPTQTLYIDQEKPFEFKAIKGNLPEF